MNTYDTAEKLAVLWLQAQDLSDLTPVQVLEKYEQAKKEILDAVKQKTPSAKIG